MQWPYHATLCGAILALFHQKPEPMPRITPQTELDQLQALIAAQPDGLGIEAIAQALGDSLKRRTLQCRRFACA